jgi:hypothetical protein
MTVPNTFVNPVARDRSKRQARKRPESKGA